MDSPKVDHKAMAMTWLDRAAKYIQTAVVGVQSGEITEPSEISDFREMAALATQTAQVHATLALVESRSETVLA